MPGQMSQPQGTAGYLARLGHPPWLTCSSCPVGPAWKLNV
ncbi:hypothetical protein Nmel_014097 [Mimus melanotis]